MLLPSLVRAYLLLFPSFPRLQSAPDCGFVLHVRIIRLEITETAMTFIEKIVPFIQDLFPGHAEYRIENVRRVSISWGTPIPGQPHRRATPVKIYFEGNCVELINDAATPDMLAITGPAMKRVIRMALVQYNPDAGDHPPFDIYVYSDALGF